MDYLQFLNKLKPLEWAAVAVFLIYIVFPVNTPTGLVPYVDTPFSMLVYLLVTLFLFYYTNPVLGILYIFVVYELIRRSTQMGSRVPLIAWTPSQKKMDAQMQAMAPPQSRSLEEEVVAERGQIDTSRPLTMIGDNSSFRPVSESTWGASLI